MSEEGFSEIQLRGKQLVFLAMSATVVAVVIFLCGVLVGRGVPPARQAVEPIGPDAGAPALTAGPDGDIDIGLEPTPAEQPDDLSYPGIVSDPEVVDALVKPESPAPAPFTPTTAVASSPTEAPPATRDDVRPAKAVAGSRRSTSPPRRSVPAATAAPAAARATNGFLVQVAAYQREGDAASLRDRLKRKGYPAFVATASTPLGTRFRVRVGGYDSKGEAESVSSRLKREERLDPWVTR
jgi:DedD protein